ncbi:MAG: vWA domain-containing protein [Planctomycetota bacterium]|nr:vWA domain-containing protein [Planctomycetota bacterium]
MNNALYEFNPWLNWLAVLGIAVVCLVAVFWFFRSATVPVRGKRGALLLALRLATLLLMLFISTRFTVAHIRTVQKRTPLLIAIDASRSMKLVSSKEEGTRWRQALDFLDEHSDRFDRLEESFEVEWVAFDGSVRPFSPDIQPTGYRTALGDVLSNWRARLAPGSAGAALVISDGMNNYGVDLLEVAGELRLDRRPVFAIGVGKRKDSLSRTDASVEDIKLPSNVTSDMKFIVEGFLKLQGLAGAVVPVELFVDGKKIATREIVPSAFNATAKVEFEVEPYDSGNHLVELVVPPVEEESTDANNRIASFIKIGEGTGSILYVESRLRHEYTFVKRALSGLSGVGFYTTILRQTGMDKPADPEAFFRAYDMVILGDVPAKLLGAKALEAGR